MKELGQKLGIAHGSIKFWEMHKGPPSRENRALLVGYLGFDPDQGTSSVNTENFKSLLLGCFYSWSRAEEAIPGGDRVPSAASLCIFPLRIEPQVCGGQPG